MSECSIEKCENAVIALRLCNKHYKRMTIYGDPLFLKNRLPGEGTPYPTGYCKISINKRRKLRHVLVAERVLGKQLPKGTIVHHIDETRSNDNPANLVICQNRGYHKLLHRRMKALKETGHANWVQCRFCKIYEPPEEMAGRWWHRHCYNKAQKERKLA